MSEVALIILAAGEATRMGAPKQLLDFGDARWCVTWRKTALRQSAVR